MAQSLSHKQQMAILEFIKTGQVEAACNKAGVAKSTYYDWLKIPEFNEELQKQQDEIYKNSLLMLKTLCSKVIKTQERLLDSEDERIQLRASSVLLNSIVKIVEVDSLKQRLMLVESQIKSQNELHNVLEVANDMRANHNI